MADTRFLTELRPDEALRMDAQYRWDAADRRYIDDQIRALQSVLDTSLLHGWVAAYFRVDPAIEAPLQARDVVCFSGTLGTVTLATPSALASVAGRVLGVVVRGGPAGGVACVAMFGVLPPEVSRIDSAGTVGPDADGRLAISGSPTIGSADANGNVFLATTGGGGGSGLPPGGTVGQVVTNTAPGEGAWANESVEVPLDMRGLPWAPGDNQPVEILQPLTGFGETIQAFDDEGLPVWYPVSDLPGTLHPDVGGIAPMPDGTYGVQTPFTREVALGTQLFGAGTTTIIDLVVGSTAAQCARKILFECFACNSDRTKVQTLDGARKIKVVAGTPTLVMSGSDTPDDAEALGATFAFALTNVGGLWHFTAAATMPSAGRVTIATREVF